jgi:hypothetical protein
LRVSIPGHIDRDVYVAENEQVTFDGRQVLVAIVGEVEQDSLRDWVQFHANMHGVDAVLIYNTNPYQNSSADHLHAISSVERIEVGVVVEWPHPMGPSGGSVGAFKKAPWDSNYGQSVILDHARRRFLNRASGVLHLAVNELVVRANGSIFDELSDSSGLIYLHGVQIEQYPGPSEGVAATFRNYAWSDSRRPPTSLRWAVDPRRVKATRWKARELGGVNGIHSQASSVRYFRGIRAEVDPHDASGFDPNFYIKDQDLSKSLALAFPEDDSFVFLDRRPLSSFTLQGRIRDLCSGLEPQPGSIRFESKDSLMLTFQTALGPYRVSVRFGPSSVSTQVQADEGRIVQALADFYRGSGPWRLDDMGVKPQSDVSVADVVVSRLQERLDEIEGTVPSALAMKPSFARSWAPLSVLRRTIEKLSRLSRRLG